jgi:diguanylate cyclase (GGDEF)-like protein
MSGVESTVTGQARRRRLSGVAMVLIVPIIGILATTGAVRSVGRGQQRLATQAMDHYIADTSEVIADQVSHYGDALTDLAAGISSQDRFTNADFNAMTVTLSPTRLSGASGIGFVVPASDEQIPETETYWRDRGATGLRLHRTGAGIQHKFVIFSRSFTGAAQNPGRDLSAQPETEDTLRVARETGAFTLSRAHVLLRDRKLPPDQQQMSFILAVPVYGRPGTARSGTVLGWVTMGVRGGDFLTQVLHTQSQGAIQLSLNDPAVSDSTVVAAVSAGNTMRAPGLYRSRILVVGQHDWRLTVRPTTKLLSVTDRRSTNLTLLAGTLFTALLTALAGALAGGRARAMDRVDEATAALRKDIERREALEQELHRLAFHDQLTGLANRSLFYDRVGETMLSHRRDDESFAVFFIDLDGFKQVNDELGHSAGDIVLRVVADRLRDCLRDSDTVARFGGDEFAVILERVAGPDDVHITAERIVAAVRQPIDVGRREASVTASVGVAVNRAGDTADDILREADLAMYTAKTTGKSRHVLAGAT